MQSRLAPLAGWGQGWVKLWCDGNHNHICEQVNLYNNLFVNRTVAVRSGGVFYEKHIGTVFPSNLGGFQSDYNLFWSMGSAPSLGLSGYDANSLFTDPMITDNYELNTGSPAIDAGVDLRAIGVLGSSETFVDINNSIRPNSGGAYDIGAFEFGGTSGGPSTTQLPVPSNLRLVK